MAPWNYGKHSPKNYLKSTYRGEIKITPVQPVIFFSAIYRGPHTSYFYLVFGPNKNLPIGQEVPRLGEHAMNHNCRVRFLASDVELLPSDAGTTVTVTSG